MNIIFDEPNIPNITLWPLGIFISIIIFFVVWRRSHNLSNLVFLAIFEIYVLFAIDVVFFPIQVTGEFVNNMKQGSILTYTNFIPLYFDRYGLTIVSLWGMIDNILLTIPLGFGLNFILPVKRKSVIWLAIVPGLVIEITQLILSFLLGYAYRVCDVNDVILNAIGVFVGYGLFRVFAWLYLILTERFAIKLAGLFAYIHQVASRV